MREREREREGEEEEKEWGVERLRDTISERERKKKWG